MSLNRLALRLAAVSALGNNGVAPFPTLAGVSVYDSKLAPVDFSETDKQVPIVIVYSDKDNKNMRDGSGAGLDSDIDFLIEIAVGSFQGIKDDGGDAIEFVTLEMDSEVEAILDVLEWQVLQTLRSGGGTFGKIFRTYTKNLQAAESERASIEGNNRTAIRQLRLNYDTVTDCSQLPILSQNGDLIDIRNGNVISQDPTTWDWLKIASPALYAVLKAQGSTPALPDTLSNLIARAIGLTGGFAVDEFQAIDHVVECPKTGTQTLTLTQTINE